MKAPQWVRLLVLAFAFMSVAGVLAVMACGPSAPAAPPNGAGNVSDSVSAPATEVPFVLQQPGGGDGGVEIEMTSVDSVLPQQSGNEPTNEQTETPTPAATRYIPPTADRSLCSETFSMPGGRVTGTRCPPDGHSLVSHDLRQHYNYAMKKNDALGLTGDDLEFPVRLVRISIRSGGNVDDVVDFLKANGVTNIRKWSDSRVSARMSVGLIPELMEIERVGQLVDNTDSLKEPASLTMAHPTVDDDLWIWYVRASGENSARARRGLEPVRYPTVRILIDVWGVKDVDPIVNFLKASGAEKVTWTKDEEGELFGTGTVEADVSLGLIGDIDVFDGVRGIEEVRPTSRVTGGGEPGPTGGTRRDSTVLTPTPLPAAVVAQADQWNRVGFTGAGVGVAVIDAGFRDFRARILPSLSNPVRFLCYDSSGVAKEGVISAATSQQGGVPAGYFDACEDRTSHGTSVVASLLEMSPDVTLYLSNSPKANDYVDVLQWLTAGAVGDDGFNVQVINHSRGSRWDGSGDGRSYFDDGDSHVLLNVAQGAVDAGVLWVNAAGNHGRRTWFKYDPGFDTMSVGSSRRFLDFSGSDDACNSFRVEPNKIYDFQLRWWDNWPGADTDLDLVLYPWSGAPSDPVTDIVFGGDAPQSGADGSAEHRMAKHYPRERLHFLTHGGSDGVYCLAVELKSGQIPEWVQLQMYIGPESASLRYWTDMGSLSNPAESDDDGMLSAGFVHFSRDFVDGRSSRGPGPWPRDRQTLDLVSDGTNLHMPSGRDNGSSGAAARVAGLSALVIQALGDRDRYDEPDEIARYMKQFGSTRRTCDHEWGCGFAMLPPLDPPTNLRLESAANACPVGRQETERSVRNVTLVSDPPENGNPDYSVPYFLDLKKVGDPDADSSSLRYGGLHGNRAARLPGGETYVARGYTCLFTFSGELVCGMASAPSNELTVPRAVCQPILFDVHLGDEMLTLWWNHQPDATEYEVQRVDGDGNAVAGSGVKTGDNHLVVSGLTNGELYSFQVLARGPSGTSAWSVTRGGVPDDMLPPTVFPIRSLRNETGFDWPRKLAGNRPDYGEGLYSGQSRLAEQGDAGKAFGPKGSLGSGPVVSGLRGQGHLLRFAGLVAGPAVQR